MKARPSSTPETGEEVNVGRRLRQLRQEAGISLRSLAERSGLNINTLSLIENEKTSPSVSTLQQLAAALEAPITAFFESPAVSSPIVYQRAGDRQAAHFAFGNLSDLRTGFSQGGLEPFQVWLEPNTSSGSASILHTGIELVYCLEGQLEYEVEGQVFPLGPGDSLIFEAHLAHRWHNPGPGPTRSLLIIAAADQYDHLEGKHFNR